MKFEVDNKHREFFLQYGWLECQRVWEESAARSAQVELAGQVAQRLHVPAERLERVAPEFLLGGGRDVWRTSAAAKTLICQRQLAGIASQLVELSPLRLGYDQLFLGSVFPYARPHEVQLTKAMLAEVSSIQGVVCGVIMALTDHPEQPASTALPVVGTLPLPKEAGSCVFFLPSTTVDFPALLADPQVSYLMIVYCQSVSCYVACPRDPFSDTFKAFGYSYGDRLLDQYHPVIFQQR